MLFMLLTIAASAQKKASGSEEDRAKKYKIAPLTEQIAKQIANHPEKLELQYSVNKDEEFTSRAIYFTDSTATILENGDTLTIEYTVRVMNQAPLNDWFLKKWWRQIFVRDVKFVKTETTDEIQKVKFRRTDVALIYKSKKVKKIFEELERTILQGRRQYLQIKGT